MLLAGCIFHLRRWAGDEGFSVDLESIRKDKDLLDRARVAYDAAEAAAKSALVEQVVAYASLFTLICRR